MDATYIHLVLSHFPIIGSIIGTITFAYGLYFNIDLIKKVALVTLISMSIMTIPVFITGEESEETVEHLQGVPEILIEEHEELAEIAIWLMGSMGVASIFCLITIAKKWSFSKIVALSTLLVSLATCGIFAQVGNLGGKIRHSEIRQSNINSNSENGRVMPEYNNHDDDDDD